MVFSPHDSPRDSLYYEADLGAVLADLEPIHSRLVARRKIPSGARMSPILDEHIDAILALHVAEFDCPPDIAKRRLAGGSGLHDYCRRSSTVLTVESDVIGAFLFFPPDSSRTIFAYGVVVAKAWRGGWANVRLKYSTFRQLYDSGVSSLQFRASPAALDTHKHAARVRSRVLRKEG